MKATELRIGNMVQNHGYYYTVLSIDKEGIIAEPITSIPSSGYIDMPYNLNPIPLTEEILLKAGFKSREASRCNEYYIGTNEVTQDWLFSLVWLHNPERINAPNAPFYRNGRHTIYYLHQLQNLYFALTGEELNINL